MGSSDFLVNIPQYVEKKMLGSTKQQFHVKPGADDDSHRFNKINFSHSKGPTMFLRINLHYCPSAQFSS